MGTFFTQKTCDRCGNSLDGGRIMSKFNIECICKICLEKEKHDKDYYKSFKSRARASKKRQL